MTITDRRYRVIEGSQSVHCCFEYTVVDTARPVIHKGVQYRDYFEAVCECFNRNDADLVCESLNLIHEQSRSQ